MLFSVEIEAHQDLLDLELRHIDGQGKVYTLLKNENISREDCQVGDKKYPEYRNFIQEKDREIYVREGRERNRVTTHDQYKCDGDILKKAVLLNYLKAQEIQQMNHRRALN